SLVDALAELHAVDVDAAGLGDLDRHDGLVARQLERLGAQVTEIQDEAARCLVLVHDLHRYLADRAPAEPPSPSIVHGEYRFDNAVVGDDGTLRAVLDWEAATLGDPLVDLGQLVVYWTDPGQENEALGASPTAVAGFPSRREVVERYAERSGRDLDRVEFYVGFAYWKLACTLEAVYARQRAHGRADPEALDTLSHQVVRLAESAREALGGP
ncbi:MAG: phosphotransferase family protein, partial [Acidimicrobiales bacterium]